MRRLIESSGSGIMPWLLATLFAIAAPTTLMAKGPGSGGGGGGGKVSVTLATPSEASQGEELDVIIDGNGFDDGSTATWYLTGTNDDTQVEVLSNEYLPATGQLKSRIRVNGNATVSDYDIEVRNSGGRRGKGTTLFKVKSVETACTGNEPKEPVIAYLTGFKLEGDYETQDLMLSSASGCDQYLLLENATVKTPFDDSKQEPEVYLVGVSGLRLDIEGSSGIATWRDRQFELDRLYAMRFALSQNGSMVPDGTGPEAIYFATAGSTIRSADVRFNDMGQVELLVVEDAGPGDTFDQLSLVYSNTDTLEQQVLMSGGCAVEDAAANCYVPSKYYTPWWSEDGTEAYLDADRLPIGSGMAISRVARVSGAWQPADILIVSESHLSVVGVRADSLLTYEGSVPQYHRNGRYLGSDILVWSIDPNVCTPAECAPQDGVSMPVDSSKFPRGWTRNGSMLFIDTGPGAQRNIFEYSNPFTGEIGPLEISDVDRWERATTF